MVRVLLADDNARFRGVLRRLLERDPDIVVVAEAGDGARPSSSPRRSALTSS